MEEDSSHLSPDTEYRYARIAALIPAYNEERFIGDVVRRTLAQIAEVVVVDDGSPDNTAAAAREAGAEVISYQPNQGKGAAIQIGLRAMVKKASNTSSSSTPTASTCPKKSPTSWQPSPETGPNSSSAIACTTPAACRSCGG